MSTIAKNADVQRADKSIHESDRRAAYRVTTDFECSIRLLDSSNRASYRAQLLDISLTGARVDCERLLVNGANVTVLLPELSQTELLGKVVRRLEVPGQRPTFGVQMIDPWPIETFYSLAFPDQYFADKQFLDSIDAQTKDCPEIEGYRILRPIGRGGSGEVFEALAPGGITKAIKRVPIDPRSALSIREVLAFRLVRSIRHPFLLSIDRLSIQDNHLNIVMEMADGNMRDEFAACLKHGLHGIPQPRLIALLREAAEVLDLLNGRFKVQHLDIKPDNLFLVAGHLKLGDFGLMRELSEHQIDVGCNAVTPWYAAPELFDGQISPTADQYSLAVVYMELLTGRRPFKGGDVRQIIFQQLTSSPDLSALPASNREIVARALSRDPTKRFRNCIEFINALQMEALPGRSSLDDTSTLSALITQNTATVPPTLSRSMPVPVELIKSADLKMVVIPAGEFLMGSPSDDVDAGENERPQHCVKITRPFQLGIHQVTQVQYEKIMGENPSCFAATGRYKEFFSHVDTRRLPVDNISWYQAIDFCNKLSETEGLAPYYAVNGNDVQIRGGVGYRLPTEAEWEYACRAGSETRWSFGDDVAELERFCRYRRDTAHRPSAVGQRRPNVWGVFDMHGNMHEWCWDWYLNLYYEDSPFEDPMGPTEGVCKVLRGGSYYDPPHRTRSAIRCKGRPADRGNNIGFRVAKFIDEVGTEEVKTDDLPAVST